MDEAARRVVTVGVVELQDAVLDHARLESERDGSLLRLVHAYDVPPTLPAPVLGLDLAEACRRGGEEVLAEALQHVEAGGVSRPVDCVLRRGFAPAVLTDESRRSRLLVIGRDASKDWVTRLFEGLATRHLMDHAHCPVVVVPRTWTPERPGTPVRGVVVMLDGRSTAHGPLAHAFEAAEARGAELQILHVVTHDANAVDEWDAMQPLLAAWCRRYPHVIATLHVVQGEPHEQAVHAGRSAGLLVLGRPHERRTPAFTSASPVRAILTDVTCPVAVVAPDHRGSSS